MSAITQHCGFRDGSATHDVWHMLNVLKHTVSGCSSSSRLFTSKSGRLSGVAFMTTTQTRRPYSDSSYSFDRLSNCDGSGYQWLPSKHGVFTQWCFNVGPASKTVDQHWNIIGWMPRVCSDNHLSLFHQMTSAERCFFVEKNKKYCKTCFHMFFSHEWSFIIFTLAFHRHVSQWTTDYTVWKLDRW